MRYAFLVEDEGDHIEVLTLLANTLTERNVRYLRRNPGIPPLYRIGVSYEQESADGPDDDWRDIPTMLALGRGDCDDLACMRAAELRVRGQNARPFISHARVNGGVNLYHVRVMLPSGQIEDPSALLGMI